MKNHRTWVELSRENVLHNVGTLRELVGKDRIICSAVKANAYGHGAKEMAPLILEGGADWLGVDCLEEAVELRESGITAPIYIMGYIELSELEEAVKRGFHFVVYNRETFEKLTEVTKALGMPALTHLKLETGTNRQGIQEDELPDFLKRYRENMMLELQGVSMHFADIEDTTNHAYASQQFEQFQKMVAMIQKAGLHPKYRHCANSAAVILFPHTYLDMVRPGIANYGLWPSRETFLSAREAGRKVDLLPVLSWKAKVAQIKKVPKGSTIGYGRTFEARRDSTIAVIPVGYYNNFNRALSNVASVLIGGEKAPVAGRVMMNMTEVDVTDIPGVSVEDEVVIIGRQGEKSISLDDVAKLQGTINYEVTAQINPKIERRVV